jgi:homoserine dehydrogenase
MSAVLRASAADAPARVALLGTGQVGSALLARLQGSSARHEDALVLVATANTRRSWTATVAAPVACDHADTAVRALGDDGIRIVVDATASAALAARHARWLGAGLHVVTACKLGQGTGLARWSAIADACRQAGSSYGDSATVGAGLPLLPTIRALRAGGERIHALAGVLSGSLAWLFSRFDGSVPFETLLREAQARGYTEPDPREDLGGEDVRRKLLILARAAGFALEHDAVVVETLSPDAMAARLDAANATGRRLAYVARLQCGPGGAARARAGLEALAPGDPLAAGAGTDNRVAIWCDRYPAQPLRIQGPGAGAAVTAAALLDDMLRISASARARGGWPSPAPPGSP